jgi:hypothetical protein
LELIHALGPLGAGFVVAGAQAMKFAIIKARGTKDVDFVLDVVHLRGQQQHYFKSNVSPGVLLYEELLVADQPAGRDVRRQIKEEVLRAHALISRMFGLV